MRRHRRHPRAVRDEKALDYLIGEKLFTFVEAAEQDADFAAELPAFVAAIQRLFPAEEIRAYLDHLERTKFLAHSSRDREGTRKNPGQPTPCWARRNSCVSPVSGNCFSPSTVDGKNMAKLNKVSRYENRIRKPVTPGQKIPLSLSTRERELILEHTFADDELTVPLRTAPTSARRQSIPSRWMIWKNSPAMLQPKPTMPRTRNFRRSWISCSPGWKRCWNPTRTR